MRTNEDHEMRTRAVFPGTFDPFTAGHLSLAERGHGLFDELVIAVFDNSAKNPRMKKDERLALIRRATAHLPGIRVEEAQGLLADWCRDRSISFILRGLRNTVQFDEESAMADANRLLGGLETVFLPARPDLRYVSSTLVREIAGMGGDLTALVPASIKDDIARAYRA